MHANFPQGRTLVGRVAQSWLLAVLIGLAGVVLVIGPSVTHGLIPGDVADGRFNTYLLEHFYRWLTGRDRSFWDAQFCYPYPLTIAFSDNYLGDGVIYAMFRWFGLVRVDAFRCWYALGYVIDFAAALYALSRLGYSRLGAALGAFLFAFGMPMTAQEGHAQLVYRFGVPLAVCSLLEVESGSPLLRLRLVAFWTTWQFYCSIYIGYFLVLLLGALTIGQALSRERTPIGGLVSLPAAAYRGWCAESVNAKMMFAASMASMAALLGLLFFPYVDAAHIYGLRRSWADISSMLPRPASYLHSENSKLWPSSSLWFNTIPIPQEHAMFIGITPYLAIAAAVILRNLRRGPSDRLFAPMVLAVLLLAALTLWIDGHSLYWPIARVPGADAIRAVTRIIVVMMFPFSILMASSIDTVASAQLPAPVRSTTLSALMAMLIFEASFISHYASPEQQWQARMAGVVALLPAEIPAHPILLLGPVPGEPWFFRAVDAMVFAQDHGWPTINGYSGNLPTGYQVPITCQQGLDDLAKGLAAIHRSQDYASLARHVVMLGYPSTCQAPAVEH